MGSSGAVRRWNHALEAQELPLPMEPAGEAAQTAAGGQDPMAWHENGDGIGAAGTPDRPGCGGIAGCPGHLRVAQGTAGGDLAQGAPHPLLEVRAAGEIDRGRVCGRAASQGEAEGLARGGVPPAHECRRPCSPNVPGSMLPAQGKAEAAQAFRGVVCGELAFGGWDRQRADGSRRAKSDSLLHSERG
jgi:hypothetical protein